MVVYLLKCERCRKDYVGSTINSFRERFNNHESSLLRYGKEKKGILSEHLYSRFFAEGHAEHLQEIPQAENVTF